MTDCFFFLVLSDYVAFLVTIENILVQIIFRQTVCLDVCRFAGWNIILHCKYLSKNCVITPEQEITEGSNVIKISLRRYSRVWNQMYSLADIVWKYNYENTVW